MKTVIENRYALSIERSRPPSATLGAMLQASVNAVHAVRGASWISRFSRYALSICSAAAMLAGCGGQQLVSPLAGSPDLTSVGIAPGGITPDGIAPGYMKITFDVAAPLKYSKYQYQVIFDTTGSGKTPEVNNWLGYSFALETVRQRGAPTAHAIAFIRNRNRHVPPAQLLIGVTPRQFQFAANSNGAGTEFTILFQRSIFNAFERHRKSSTWLFNAFTNSESGFVDSMASCGTCFVSPKLSVDKTFDERILASKKPKGIEPSAKIVSVEFANNP
jgi:hypothetical protein